MNEHPASEHIPDSVLRVLDTLERWTGRLPTWQVMVAISLTGLTITALVVAAVAWGERLRQRNEFDAIAGRHQMVVQTRLDHHLALLEQVSRWATEQARLSGVGTGTWSAAGVTVLRPEDLDADMLAARLDIDDALARDATACVRQASLTQATAVCRLAPARRPPSEAVRSGAGQGWLLAVPVAEPGRGWAMAPVWADRLLSFEADQLAWRFSFELIQVNQAAPGTVAALEPTPDGALQADKPLSMGPVAWRLRASAQPVSRSWQEVISRQAGVWIAGLAGLMFTMAAVHVYLMLISTRRRARAMARDMSAALHRTQTRNQAVMDAAPDAILIVDATGCVRWSNQAVASIFGLTSESIQGHPLSVVLPAFGEQTLDDWFATYGFSNRVIGHETTGRRNEGVPFPVAVSASRVEVDGDTVQTLIVRDTTDAKWAEQELTLRDRALASSADGVVIVSMTLPNQPMIYVNRAFEEITGYEAHELLGLNCRMFQRDDTRQPGVDAMRQAIEQGKGCQVVVRNYRKNGALFYNELAISPVLGADGSLSHYVGVATDITDRIAAEQVLNLRTERLNAVFDLSPDGFVVLDKRGEISIVNPAFERMTGLLAADLVGQSSSAFEEQLMDRCKSREGEEPRASPGDGGAAGDGAASSTGRELLHLHTPCNRTLVRRVRQGGHDNETVMYFRDITHELEVDRMKSEFLAMAAHELRTPMVSIFGFTELLLRRTFTEERRNDMLSTIHRQASVLINLVNELLDLARIESRRGKDFNRERQPLQPLIEDAIGGLLMHNDTRLVGVSLPQGRILVDADRQKLSLALTNVLSNAYKYSPQGGDIALDLLWRDRQGRTECGIRVTDHGIGMTPEQLEKLFDRFFRADTSGNIPGTGLGMTIVKEIVELHGGQVSVTSEFGQGTTVILWIPAIEVQDADVQEVPLVGAADARDEASLH